MEKPKAEPRPHQPVDVRFKEMSGAKEVYSTTAAKIGPAPETKEKPEKPKPQPETPDAPDAVVARGAPCLHNGCKAAFEGEISRVEPCVYHPGQAFFHEGSKYWTCCRRGCLEFEEMLQQPGCNTGRHKFVKDAPVEGAIVNCRVQSYQSPTEVCVNLFAKNADKNKSRVSIRPDAVEIEAVMGDGTRCVKNWKLSAKIDVVASTFVFFGTKIDIVLKKADTDAWDLSVFK